MMDLAWNSSSRFICPVWLLALFPPPLLVISWSFSDICCFPSVLPPFSFVFFFVFLFPFYPLSCFFYTPCVSLALRPSSIYLHISHSGGLVKHRQDSHGWLSLSISQPCILRYYLASLNQTFEGLNDLYSWNFKFIFWTLSLGRVIPMCLVSTWKRVKNNVFWCGYISWIGRISWNSHRSNPVYTHNLKCQCLSLIIYHKTLLCWGDYQVCCGF